MNKKILSFIILFCFINTFVFPQSSIMINDKLNEQNDLLQALEEEVESIRLYVSQLKANNKELSDINVNLENTVDSCNQKIDNLMTNIESMRKALESNKEDTSNAIGILGDMYVELENYKTELNLMKWRNKNANNFVEISIPIMAFPLIGFGLYEYCSGNENMGKIMMIVGTTSLIGCELVWNGGKFIFKIW